MEEINTSSKRKLQKREHSYKIHGNVIDLYATSKKISKNSVSLIKRLFVSPEFIELFFKIHDGDRQRSCHDPDGVYFDEALFDRLSDKEKKEMAFIVKFLNIENRHFTVALSKMNRAMHARLQLIEGAIKAGNLSTELRDEYIDIMKNMQHLGMLPSNTASRYISSIHNTYKKLTQM